jgi:hypothetical protein
VVEKFFESTTFYTFLDDNDPHFAAIGRVATSWALLEVLIDQRIATLTSATSESIACITAQLIGPARRMDALIALARLREFPEALIAELKAISGRIQQLGENRNRVVHDPIFQARKTGDIYKATITAKGKLVYGAFRTSLDEMQRTEKAIKLMVNEFYELSERLGAALHEINKRGPQRTLSVPPDRNPGA